MSGDDIYQDVVVKINPPKLLAQLAIFLIDLQEKNS